jgi:catechol 2,3-dioxygenase-like lactoylglutathione lyase family enzyme
MPDAKKARAVGLNHIALEVGDVDEALSFYGRIFAFELRGKSEDMAFSDLGDQFLALQKGRRQSPDEGRHFGAKSDVSLVGEFVAALAHVRIYSKDLMENHNRRCGRSGRSSHI